MQNYLAVFVFYLYPYTLFFITTLLQKKFSILNTLKIS